MAVDAHCLRLVQCLIENRADINATDEDNNTALLLALEGPSRVGNTDMEFANIVRFLVNQGADVSITCLLTGVSAKYYAENFARSALKHAFFSSNDEDGPNATANDNQSEKVITPRVALMQVQKLFFMATNANPSLTEDEGNYQNSLSNSCP